MLKEYYKKHYKILYDNININSLKTYYYWFKKINNTFNLTIFTNLDKLKNTIIDYDIKYKKQLIISLIRVFKILNVKKTIIDKYNDYYIELQNINNDDNNNITNDDNNNNNDNKEYNKCILTIKDIYNIRNEAVNKYNIKPSIKNALKVLILYLYTEIVPLRNQDYINTSFSMVNSVNFIDLEKKTLFIREGKRTTQYNARKITLSDNVIKYILILKKELEKKNYVLKWLIPKITNPTENMKTDTYNKFLNSIFGKGCGASKLRNIYASYWTDEGITPENRKKNAELMGHTTTTQIQHYNKYSYLLSGNIEKLPKYKALLIQYNNLVDENKKLFNELYKLKNP